MNLPQWSRGLLIAAALPAVSSGIQMFSSFSEFNAAATVVSTQTFEQFNPGLQFAQNAVTLGGVVYESESRLSIFGPPYLPGTNALISNEIVPSSMSFGAGRYVESFGFSFGGFTSFQGPVWRIGVQETNAALSTFDITPLPSYPWTQYFGFISDVGIESVSVRQILQSGGVNWFYDDVSRGEIYGGAALPDDWTVEAPRAVPDTPSTAMLALALAALVSIHRYRGVNVTSPFQKLRRFP
jgi:hypothetical protein